LNYLPFLLSYKSQPINQMKNKRIFVNVFINGIIHHARCAIDIPEDSCGIEEAAKLSVEIANENNVDIGFVRFEIIK